MTERTHTIATVGLIVLTFVGGVGVGWWARPAKVVTVEKRVEVEKTHDQAMVGSGGSINVSASVTGLTRTTERRYRPDGSLAAVRSSTTGTEAKQATQAQSVEVRWRDKDREVIRTVEVTKLVEGQWPRWLVTAAGGVQWTGSRLWGGGISYRLLGPFTAGIDVYNIGPMLRLGVTW